MTLTTRSTTNTPSPATGKYVGTASSATRWLGITALVGVAVLLVFAFVLTDPDQRVDPDTNIVIGQFDAVRLLYVHVPVAIIPYIAFSITAAASVMVLLKRSGGSTWWDITAAAAAEVGVLFAGLTLITGMIWGRPIWNTWWEWGDVRLMTSLMLFLVYLGYLAYRRAMPVAETRARRSAVVGIVGMINIPIVNRSVEWWENRTLHQKSTLTEMKIEDLTLFSLILGFVVFGLIFAWLMLHRFRIGWLEHQSETVGLDAAIAARQAQAQTGTGIDDAVDHPGLGSGRNAAGRQDGEGS